MPGNLWGFFLIFKFAKSLKLNHVQSYVLAKKFLLYLHLKNKFFIELFSINVQ